MYLLDTDTIIYALKDHPLVVDNFRRHEDDPKAISVMSYGELIYGAERSARREENLAKVRRLAEILPIIDVTRSVMDAFGALKASTAAHGKTVADFDLTIAATALCLGYRVVTNNLRHFSKIPGVVCESWARPVSR